MKKQSQSQNNTALEIKKKRNRMGLTQREFAELLGLTEAGERTVRGWENGEHIPTPTKYKIITQLKENAPFKNSRISHEFSFIDLFAGIGGIRIPFQEIGGKCVFTSEWDKYAKKTYAANFGELPHGDIVSIPSEIIPDHDLLLAGFPCQAFSQAGLRRGFQDTRGTMFFEIQRILSAKRPKAFLLENVKQLRGHDKGRTLQTIIKILTGDSEELSDDIPITDENRKNLKEEALNYWVDYRVLNAKDYGVPQNRERIYIVGFNKDAFPDCNFEKEFFWPAPLDINVKLGDILEENSTVDKKYTLSDKLWEGHQRRKKEHKEKGNGFGYSLFNKESLYTNTISARYYKDGSEILVAQDDISRNPRKLTPGESAKLQGFPEGFVVDAVSDVQLYRQFGNSVAVPVIRAIAKCMHKTMQLSGNKVNG